VSFRDIAFPSKKLCWPLCLKVARFLLKKCNTPFKETQLPSVWKEHHLFEGKVLLTKKKIESAAPFESYTMI
jgi:hypothetical protein